MSADGNCGVDSFGSVVPATGACVINQPPRFVSDGTVALSPTRSIFDTPGLLEYHLQQRHRDWHGVFHRVLPQQVRLDRVYLISQVAGLFSWESST